MLKLYWFWSFSVVSFSIVKTCGQIQQIILSASLHRTFPKKAGVRRFFVMIMRLYMYRR